MAKRFDPQKYPRGGDPRNAGRFSGNPHTRSEVSLGNEEEMAFADLLDSAARFQELVPDAVLVGGSAAAFYAGHRVSYDHDHVVQNLRSRYDSVFEVLDSNGNWFLSPRATKSPNTIMGSFDGFQAGLRNLRRSRPLEIEEHTLPSGAILRVPTEPEILRVKAYLVVQRNAVRDYLDVAALSDHLGTETASGILREIDDYYVEHSQQHGSVSTELAVRLGDPQPKDSKAIRSFESYKGVDSKWKNWQNVVDECKKISAKML